MSRLPVTRRHFMKVLAAAGSSLVGVSIGLSAPQLIAIASGKATLKKVIALSKLKKGVNGPYNVTLDAPDPNDNQVFLVKNAKGQVTALESTCRHMGCPINWVPASNRFICPCHGSQYDMHGTVVHGPAQANLYQHKVVVKAGQVWVISTRATM